MAYSTVKTITIDPNLEAATYALDGTKRIYYQKYGKLYVLTGFYNPSVYYYPYRGKVGGVDDTDTLNRICSILGITAAAYVMDTFNQLAIDRMYWDGAAWTSRAAGVGEYTLYAILAN